MAEQGADMLRTLLILTLPCVTLLADLPELPRASFPDLPSRLDLVAIPIAAAIEKSGRSEQAQLRLAAGNGDLEAQVKLGMMFYQGEGVEANWDEARAWLRKASEAGHAGAQAKMGAMCFLGQGGPRDLDESLVWFRKAAEQGEPYAQGCMGVMYAVGEGVPKDLVEAYAWLLLAQAGGDADAAEPFEQVKKSLSPAEIQEGNRRAQEAVKQSSPSAK